MPWKMPWPLRVHGCPSSVSPARPAPLAGGIPAQDHEKIRTREAIETKNQLQAIENQKSIFSWSGAARGGHPRARRAGQTPPSVAGEPPGAVRDKERPPTRGAVENPRPSADGCWRRARCGRRSGARRKRSESAPAENVPIKSPRNTWSASAGGAEDGLGEALRVSARRKLAPMKNSNRCG